MFNRRDIKRLHFLTYLLAENKITFEKITVFPFSKLVTNKQKNRTYNYHRDDYYMF